MVWLNGNQDRWNGNEQGKVKTEKGGADLSKVTVKKKRREAQIQARHSEDTDGKGRFEYGTEKTEQGEANVSLMNPLSSHPEQSPGKEPPEPDSRASWHDK